MNTSYILQEFDERIKPTPGGQSWHEEPSAALNCWAVAELLTRGEEGFGHCDLLVPSQTPKKRHFV